MMRALLDQRLYDRAGRAGRARDLRRLALACLLLALAPAVAFAQNHVLTYPGVNATTEFTIGNLNPDSVSVDVAFYHATSGELTRHVQVLASRQQIRFTASSLGLATDFIGTAVVTSGLPVAVTATLFETGGGYEHLSPAEPALDLVIPLASYGQSSTEIAIFNPGDESARTRVVLVGSDGVQIGFREQTIAAKATLRETFASQEGAAYIVVRTGTFFLGGRPVIAAARIRSLFPPAGEGVQRNDVVYMAGRPAGAETESATLPLVRHGAGALTLVQVINNAAARQTVTLTLRGADGQVVTGSNNPREVELPGRAALTDSVENIFGISESNLVSGSVAVSGQARLTAVAGLGRVSAGSFAAYTADAITGTSFAYHLRQVGREFTWLVSLKNTATTAAAVDLSFVLDDGTVVSTVGRTIPASGQLVAALAEIFPEAQGAGFVLVESNVPLTGSGLETRADESAAAPLRALPANLDLAGSPPGNLFTVGTIRSNGVGLAGATVRLTGPVTATTLTDRAGTFIFQSLSPGAYALTAEVIGFNISPSQLNFALADESSRDNDFTATLVAPAITQLSPLGVPVGSGDVELTIQGGPFITGSRVVLGTTELPTTRVNSQVLRATAAASLLTSPVELSLFVRNHGLGGDFVDSPPVTFTVGEAPAVITKLSGQPVPLIAGHSGFTLTVEGLGFIPGVSVFVDGVPHPATFLSDTLIQVALTAADLEEGGFVPIVALNPGPSIFSNAVDLVVSHPQPAITAVTPNTAEVRLTANAPALPLAVTGSGFVDGAVVLVDGTPVATTFVSPTSLTAAAPATLLMTSGVRSVQATNPDPALAASFAAPLTLTNPAPVLDFIVSDAGYDPARASEVQTAPVLLLGSSFSANSTAWVSSPCDGLGFRLLPNIPLASGETVPPEFQTRRLSPNTISATVRLECAGNYTFQVRSPQPGGGVSANVVLAVPSL